MEKYQLEMDAWKKVVDVQMHFNDLCLRVRSYAISILGVLLGAAAISYRYAGSIEIWSFRIHTSCLFLIISIVVWLSIYLMDRYWYHELLRGSVHHGRRIEESLKEYIPNISLASSIREASHSSLNVNAAKKLNFFYLGIAFVQILTLLILLFGSVIILS